MNPWAVLEWSLALGLSAVVIFIIFIAIALSTKFVLGKTNPKRTRKPVVKKPAVKPTPAPVAAKADKK